MCSLWVYSHCFKKCGFYQGSERVNSWVELALSNGNKKWYQLKSLQSANVRKRRFCLYSQSNELWTTKHKWTLITRKSLNKLSHDTTGKWSQPQQNSMLQILHVNLSSNCHSYTPGLAILALIASACFFFHFLISLSICSRLSGLSDHRHPFLCEAPWGLSSLQNALFKERLCRTEFWKGIASY